MSLFGLCAQSHAVTGKQRDAVGARVMPKEMAGHAALVAAAGAEHVLIEPGDVERHHGDFCKSPLLAGSRGFCRLRPMLGKVPPMQGGGFGTLSSG